MKFLNWFLLLLFVTTSASSMDVNGQLKNAQLEQSTTNPTSNQVKGRIFFDSDDLVFRFYNGTSWLSVADLSQKLSAFASTSSSELAGKISDETGSGLLVFATSPTLTTPVLGVATATSINGTSVPSSKTLVVTTDKLSVLAATSSSELAGVISDETGSGLAVFATSPSLTTPVLGVATATSINKMAITAPGTSSTLAVANGKTLTASNTLTFTGTDSSSVNFNTGGTVAYTANSLSAFAATTSAELAGVISDETGTGLLCYATSPTLTTPVLGVATATSINGTSIPSSKTLVVTTDNLSALASTTSSQLLGVLSDETGTGSAVFATSPTLVTPTIGVATATSINKMSITAPTSSSTLAVADGKTLTASNTLTFTGTDSSSVAFGTGGTVAYTGGKLSQFAATSSSELAGVISDETGSGALCFATSPTLTTPVLGVATATSINGTSVPSSKTLVVTTDKLSVLAATSSSELAGVISDETGSGLLTYATTPTLTTPNVTTQATFLAGGEVRFNNASDTFYVGFKGGNAAANKIWTLPLVDGSANNVLSTNGSGVLSWAGALSSSLNQYNLNVGDSTNTGTSTNTNLLGDVAATTSSATVTITIASPGVVTLTSHGFSTGDKVYLTTTGALPTGLTASTTYYVIPVNSSTFRLATTLTNAASSTAINTSGSQSGVHTLYSGGLTMANGVRGVQTSSDATAGFIGEYLESKTAITNFTGSTGAFISGTTVALTPGDFDCQYFVTITPNGATFSATDFQIAVLASTAGSATNYLESVSGFESTNQTPIGFVRANISSPTVRVKSDGVNLVIDGNSTAQTNVQGKILIGNWTGGPPKYSALLRCRRMR